MITQLLMEKKMSDLPEWTFEFQEDPKKKKLFIYQISNKDKYVILNYFYNNSCSFFLVFHAGIRRCINLCTGS